jgi:hypothetical protein
MQAERLAGDLHEGHIGPCVGDRKVIAGPGPELLLELESDRPRVLHHLWE